MIVSLSWLKEYVPIEMEVHRLADALTMVGLEVASISDRYDYMDSVVVGKLNQIDLHPNADTLKTCSVDIGNRMVSIVCGAPNLEKGMHVPVALPGTLFPDGLLLEKTVVRGVTSEGMICSEKELGLGTDQSGVLALNQQLSVGDKLGKALALSDMIFDIDLTPNRSDCLSILGIAREIAAIQKTKLAYPVIHLPGTENHISKFTSVKIEAPDHCPRYAARLLFDVSVAPSPFWLQDRLISVGLRPINNIVDVTNFVLMETGQPLHAFDLDRLAENRIVVRLAKKGELFTALDQKDRILSSDTLMICDGEKAVAIGGVMGGLNSEIEISTTRVLIESAYFSPLSIRRTSKKLNLATEASYRFERGVDPEGTIKALDRAAQLMTQISDGRLIGGIVDEYPTTIPKKRIVLSTKQTNRLLGTDLNRDEMNNLLKSIEFSVETVDKDNLAVVPPDFRVDIKRPEDAMEEIARLAGYNNIPTTFPLMPTDGRQRNRRLYIRNRIKRLMIGFGFSEAINYSFDDRESCDHLGLGPKDPRRNLVDILNPLTEEQAAMRTSLIPGLLRTVQGNISQQIKNLKLFEVGKIFISVGRENLPDEKEIVAILWTGTRSDPAWHSKETPCDFFDIKGVIEGLFKGLNFKDTVFAHIPEDDYNYTRPGETAQILYNNELIGMVGMVAPSVLQNFGLKQTVYIAEINIDLLFPLLPEIKQSKPIPKYPAVYRDFTIIVDKEVASGKILACVGDAQEKLVESTFLFDVFEGNPIPEDKKSISFRITYRSTSRTLEDEEVNQVHQKISGRLLKSFDATLPV